RRRRRRGEDSSLIPAAFHDAADAERRYDAGEYVHEGIGGGGALEPSFFGETCIPPAYVRERWTELFEVLEQTGYRHVGEQNLVVDIRLLAEHAEAVAEADRDQQLAVGAVVELVALPLAEGLRPAPEVDGHVEDPALRAADQLGLAGSRLEMQPAQRPLGRAR